ncbi:very short patch repair endonuclease [Marinobacterium rhizophilum]|uniref:very short patch repair endonuclease n=1 Tax=Marinobacterium rhizophilum TaxID=420402 RepID=UPI00037B4726|nr:very short patch repair endonuclease [Marinobacterium rhizophilum]
MTDLMSREARSRLMSKIGSKNTKPEMTVRRALHARGFRFRLHVKRLTGSPDLMLPKYRAVILVHGCFWHRHKGCSMSYTPKTRQSVWMQKFAANEERDRFVRNALLAEGWRVLTVWECAVRAPEKDIQANIERIADWLTSGNSCAEVSRNGLSQEPAED